MSQEDTLESKIGNKVADEIGAKTTLVQTNTVQIIAKQLKKAKADDNTPKAVKRAYETLLKQATAQTS
jgi:hypothetical protein